MLGGRLVHCDKSRPHVDSMFGRHNQNETSSKLPDPNHQGRDQRAKLLTDSEGILAIN